MNILFVDQFSEMGGAQRCLVDLLPAIRNRGWTAHLGVPGRGPLVEASRPYCASIEDLPCGPFHSGGKSWADFWRFAFQLPVQVRAIRRITRARNIDLLYVNGPRVLPAVALASTSLPVVFHAHSRVTHAGASSLVSRCLRRMDATVIASSAFVAGLLKSQRAAERVQVVYNGVAALPRRQCRRDGPLHIGVIGRIAPETGQLEFVRAAKLVLERAPDLKFVVCGAAVFSEPAYEAQVRAEAEGLGIDFLGWRDDIAPVLADLDVLAVPSGKDEATTRTILEAYAAGVPVVAFRSGGIPEVVEDSVTGWLVGATPEELAAKLRELSAHPEQLEAAAERAYQAWREKYTLQRYQDDVVCILERHQKRTPLHSAGTKTFT